MPINLYIFLKVMKQSFYVSGMNCLKMCGTNRLWRTTAPLSVRTTSSSGDSADMSARADTDQTDLPEEPTTCCMSGCANCVWIEYADQMSKRFDDGGQKSRDIILSKISDPNMKAFLEMELRQLEKSKSSNGS